MIDIIIFHNNKPYIPSIVEGVIWDTKRTIEAGTVKFTCINDEKLVVSEGDPIQLIVDGSRVFFGFVFTMKFQTDGKVELTAYDQLRYLKNKDTYMYSNKRADQLISMIADDYLLKIGTLANTQYVIGKKLEENKTLIDIIQNALNDTLTNTGKLYVLYDDFGKLMLSDAEKLKTKILICSDTIQNYSYTVDINKETYNQIKLTYDNTETGVREIYMAKDNSTISKWGVLQYYESIKNPLGAESKVNSLLNLHNTPLRTLKISGAFGDARVRGGTSVICYFDTDDLKLRNYMFVEEAKHTFKHDQHYMDLTLRGGVINSV